MRGSFGAGPLGIYRLADAVHDVVVDAVFDIGGTVLDAVEPAEIGFVVSEEQLRLMLRMLARKPVLTQCGMGRVDDALLFSPIRS